MILPLSSKKDAHAAYNRNAFSILFIFAEEIAVNFILLPRIIDLLKLKNY